MSAFARWEWLTMIQWLHVDGATSAHVGRDACHGCRIALQRQRELEQLGHRVVVADAARDLVAELRRQAPELELERELAAGRGVRDPLAIDRAGREQLEIDLAHERRRQE